MWSKNKKTNVAIWRWVIFYSLVMLGYAIWSYGLVVPNLWLVGAEWFAKWQEGMWKLFTAREMVTVTWLSWVGLMWIAAVGLIKKVGAEMRVDEGGNWNWKKILVLIGIVVGPLLFSYNALSADTFNYIFNAKMVAVYGANPHVQVATDFPNDEMVRFMHNSHTPAPYGYVWTGLSLPIWLASGGKFILAWLGMRGMAVISLATTAGLIWRGWRKEVGGEELEGVEEKAAAKKRAIKLKEMTNPLWVLLCPLLLIEIVSNNHNDLWMMAATMGSLWLVWEKKSRTWWKILLSAGLMILGTQIKLASLVAVPFWLYIVWIKDWWEAKNWLVELRKWGEKYFFDLLVLCFFVPLLTPRSQMFHPWYWSWCLVWLPFCRAKWVRVGIIAFAASSMLRYAPWLGAGGYGEGVLGQQQLVTFAGAAVIWVGIWLWEKWHLKNTCTAGVLVCMGERQEGRGREKQI